MSVADSQGYFDTLRRMIHASLFLACVITSLGRVPRAARPSNNECGTVVGIAQKIHMTGSIVPAFTVSSTQVALAAGLRGPELLIGSTIHVGSGTINC